MFHTQTILENFKEYILKNFVGVKIVKKKKKNKSIEYDK